MHWPVWHDLPREKGNARNKKKVKGGLQGNYRHEKKKPGLYSLSLSHIFFLTVIDLCPSKKLLHRKNKRKPKTSPPVFLTFLDLGGLWLTETRQSFFICPFFSHISYPIPVISLPLSSFFLILPPFLSLRLDTLLEMQDATFVWLVPQ